jgi:hypothetical protein
VDIHRVVHSTDELVETLTTVRTHPVDKLVDRLTVPDLSLVLPEGASRTEDTEITSRT